MTIAELKTVLQGISGFSSKVVYWAWPEGEAPTLPFICFHTPQSDNFAADNKVYFSANRFYVELYTVRKDVDTETLVENALDAASIFWNKDWSYIESERCYLTRYEIEV